MQEVAQVQGSQGDADDTMALERQRLSQGVPTQEDSASAIASTAISVGMPAEASVSSAEPQREPSIESPREEEAPPKEIVYPEDATVPQKIAKTARRVWAFLRRHAVVSIAVAAVLVLIGVAGFAWSARVAEEQRLEQERIEAEQKDLNTPRKVEVGITIPDYDEKHTSSVPLHITGTTKAGKEFNEVRLLTPNAAILKLLPGTYTIALAGNPATDKGVLYKGSIDSFEVTVGDEQDQEKQSDKKKPATFVFAKVEPQDVSDSDIEDLEFWMTTAGVKEAKTYVDAVKKLRQETLDKIEEEQKAREEEERKKTEEIVEEVEQQTSSNSSYTTQNNSYDAYGYYDSNGIYHYYNEYSGGSNYYGGYNDYNDYSDYGSYDNYGGYNSSYDNGGYAY